MIFYAIRLLPILIITGLVHLESFAQRITRGPYLNAVTDRSAVIRWRTDKAVKGLLVWSAEGMRFDKKIKEKIRSTEHEIKAADLMMGTDEWGANWIAAFRAKQKAAEAAAAAGAATAAG